MTTPATREGWHPMACIGIALCVIPALGLIGAVLFGRAPRRQTRTASMNLLILLILIILIVGVSPNWGYSAGWGYGPSGLLGVLLVIVIILALLGRV